QVAVADDPIDPRQHLLCRQVLVVAVSGAQVEGPGEHFLGERSQRIGALERGFSSPTRSLIIVVFRHTRRKGNDYAQAQTQPTATVREDPTATAGSPRGDPGRDPGRPAGDRNQTPRWARDPHRRRLQVLGARDRGTDRPTVGPP